MTGKKQWTNGKYYTPSTRTRFRLTTYYQERMIGLFKYAILGHCVSDFILLYDDLLLQDLDSIQLGGGFLATQDNFTESSLSEHFQELEILQRL